MTSQVHIAVVPFETPTVTGLMDVVADPALGHKNLEGLTPVAVIICGGSGLDDGVDRPTLQNVLGWCDSALNQQCHTMASIDANGSTDTSRESRDNRVILIQQNSSDFIAASVSEFIVNGVRLNFTVVDPAVVNRRMYAVLICGTDVQAHAAIVNLGTTAGATLNQTAPGFTPDLVLIGGAHAAVNPGTNAVNAVQTFGAGLPDGTCRAMYWAEADAVTAGGQPRAALHDNVAGALYSVTTGALVYSFILNDFDAAGFSIVLTGTPASQRIGYLALKFGGAGVALFDFAAATATGLQAISGLGFRPQFAMLSATAQTAKNALASDVTAAANYSFSAFDNRAMRSLGGRSDPAADPTDTANISLQKAFSIGTPTDPDATTALLDGFDDDGFTLNYDAAAGAASYAWGFAIEEGENIVLSPARVSQHALLVLDLPQSNPVVSQHVLLALAEMESNPRVTQHALLVYGDYQPCLTRRAQLWKITRRDGEVLAFTSHDQEIAFGAHTYTPCNSLNASATQQAADVEGIGNVELSGIVADEAISEADIMAGKYDDAYVEVFLVAWQDPGAGEPVSVDSVRRLAAGWTGTLSVGERGFRFEVLGPGQRLAQKTILDVFLPSCRWLPLGTPECGIDIEALKLPGTVTAVTDNGEFVALLSDTTGAAQYDQGFVRWLTGDNAGAETEIKTVTFDGFTATIVLWAEAPFLPEVGDTIEVLPGCDGTADTCKNVYDNYLEFGGFDKVPGNDEIGKTPDAKL